MAMVRMQPWTCWMPVTEKRIIDALEEKGRWNRLKSGRRWCRCVAAPVAGAGNAKLKRL